MLAWQPAPRFAGSPTRAVIGEPVSVMAADREQRLGSICSAARTFSTETYPASPIVLVARSKRTAAHAYRHWYEMWLAIDHPENASAVHARPGLWTLTKLWTTTCTSQRTHASGRWLPHSFLNCRAQDATASEVRASSQRRTGPATTEIFSYLCFGENRSSDVGLRDTGCKHRSTHDQAATVLSAGMQVHRGYGWSTSRWLPDRHRFDDGI